jgi:hypothetical protein
MKKVKMGDIYSSVPVLNSILQMELPAKASMKVVSLVTELNKQLQQAEEFRVNLVEKYGKKNKENNFVVDDKKKEEFIKEFNEFLEKDVQVFSELLEISDFGDSFKISPAQLSSIQYLFD